MFIALCAVYSSAVYTPRSGTTRNEVPLNAALLHYTAHLCGGKYC